MDGSEEESNLSRVDVFSNKPSSSLDLQTFFKFDASQWKLMNKQLFESFSKEIKIGLYLDFTKLDMFNIFALNLSIWIILGTMFQIFAYVWNLPRQLQAITLCYNIAGLFVHYSFTNNYITSATKLLLLQYDLVFCCFMAAFYTDGIASPALFPVLFLPIITCSFHYTHVAALYVLMFILQWRGYLPPTLIPPSLEKFYYLLNTWSVVLLLYFINTKRMQAIQKILESNETEKTVLKKYLTSLENALQSFHNTT